MVTDGPGNDGPLPLPQPFVVPPAVRLTDNQAQALWLVPARLVTSTQYPPALVAWRLVRTKDEFVAPAIGRVPFSSHW